jgi:hypothetical protein
MVNVTMLAATGIKSVETTTLPTVTRTKLVVPGIKSKVTRTTLLETIIESRAL